MISLLSCGVILRTLAAAELQQVLTEMELALDLSSAMCPRCGVVNLLAGFSQVFVFTRRECGDVGRPCKVSTRPIALPMSKTWGATGSKNRLLDLYISLCRASAPEYSCICSVKKGSIRILDIPVFIRIHDSHSEGCRQTR
jgi:hypothetical protein